MQFSSSRFSPHWYVAEFGGFISFIVVLNDGVNIYNKTYSITRSVHIPVSKLYSWFYAKNSLRLMGWLQWPFDNNNTSDSGILGCQSILFDSSISNRFWSPSGWDYCGYLIAIELKLKNKQNIASKLSTGIALCFKFSSVFYFRILVLENFCILYKLNIYSVYKKH